MVRRRLWAQVYVAIIGILLATIVAAGLGLKALHPEWETRRSEVPPSLVGAAEVIAASLPADPASIPAQLGDTARKLELRLAIYDRAGGVLGTTDASLPRPPAALGGPLWQRDAGGPVIVVPLPDGRVLVGGPMWRSAWGGSTQIKHVTLLAGLLVLLGMLSWPLSRRITRRVERLQAGVDSLGSGDLRARVAVEGHDEVANLARSFNRAAERIEALVSAQQRMLASASHELRSPLARLRVALELLTDPEVAPTEVRRGALLTQAGADVNELDGLIEDLLLVGRLGSDQGAAARRVDLDLLVLAAEEAARHGVEVEGAPTPVRGDERALRRLVRNLLDNADKHAGGEQVEVVVTPVEGGARLVVRDRGPGVPEAERESIFEAFHRAVDHREGAHGGVGLGLALVREIARAHGGTVHIEGRDGGGSAFVVELPATS